MTTRGAMRAATVAALLLLALSARPLAAGEQDACATVKEFGLETVESAKSVVEQCKQEENARRSRGLGNDKSGREDNSSLTPAERIEQAYSRTSRKPRAIYGEDDRLEAEEAAAQSLPNSEGLRKAIRATAILSYKTDIQRKDAGGGALKLSQYTVSSVMGRVPLCPEEKFAGQQTGGFCTAFLVAPDVVATAGHCVNWQDIDERDPTRNTMEAIFGFEMRGGKPRQDFTRDEVYDIVHIRELSKPDRLGTSPDFALLQLDREVPKEVAEPLQLAGPSRMPLVEGATRLVLIGHPSGLPKKVSLNRNSKAMQLGAGPIFRAQLNSFHGNSGSPVLFFESPNVVAGILVNGQSDFEPDPNPKRNCVRTQIYQADQLCNGERCSEGVTKSAAIEPYLP